MSLKHKCHAHKPKKGKGGYNRTKQDENLAEMEKMIVDSARVSLYLEGYEVSVDEWDKVLELHGAEPLPQSLLDKMDEISVKLDAVKGRLKGK